MRRFIYVLAALIFSISPLFAECIAGYGECPDGKCAPLGSVCCGNGRYCDSGHLCVENGLKCLDTQSDRVCSNGSSYCDSDSVCIKGNQCLLVSSDRYCGGRKYCDEGFACVDNGSNCISAQSPRYCGNGNYCKSGFECTSDGKCQQTGSPNLTERSDSELGGSGEKLPILDACLKIGSTKVVTGSIGECSDKKIKKGHWNFTNVASTRAKGCPKEIRFSAYDPGSGESQEWYTPFKLQTCGGPPQNIHTVPQ